MECSVKILALLALCAVSSHSQAQEDVKSLEKYAEYDEQVRDLEEYEEASDPK